MIEQQEYDEVDVRDLADSKEEVFTCQQFINEIKSLSQRSILYTCRYNDEELTQFYQATLQKEGTNTMSLDIMRLFINTFKELNKKEIKEEADYFQSELLRIIYLNIDKLSKKQFWKIIDNHRFNKDRDGIVSQMLLEKSKHTDYVNCINIINLLKDIDYIIEEDTLSNIASNQLLERRISDKELEPQNIVEEIMSAIRAEQSTQLERYFGLWRNKMNYAYQFITDSQVKYHIQTFLQNIHNLQNDILTQIKELYSKIEELKETCLQFDQANNRLKSQINLYDQAIEERKNQISSINHQYNELAKEHQEAAIKNQHLNAAMGEGQTQMTYLSSENQQLYQELKDYKQRYNQLYAEYEQLQKEKTSHQKLIKKEEKEKIFTQRTTKQQLDDTLHKFNKLLKERNSQRKAFAAKQQERINQIMILQTRNIELENQIRLKNQKLNSYICGSIKISQFRNSMIKNSRTYNDNNKIDLGSGIFDVRPSKLLRSSIKKKQKQEEICIINKSEIRNSLKISLHLDEQQQKQQEINSKIKNADIAAQSLPQIKEEEDISHIVDNTILPPQQNVTNIISNDSVLNPVEILKKQSINLEQKIDQKLSTFTESKNPEQLKSEYFMSKAVLINIYGVKNQTTFLMTKRRFCFFDSKLRLSKFVPIQNIKSFVFCRTNSTLFILRPKNTHQLNSKEHLTNPLIVSTRNRNAFASFLTHKLGSFLKENNIELLTRYEDDIYLKIDKQEVNLKHKIPNMKNPYRLALSHVPVFYAKLQEEGLFNIKRSAVIIVQPIGLICFQGANVTEIESKREFLYLMPLDQCKVIQKEDSKQAPDRKVRILYETDTLENYYSLIFDSKQDVKLFLKACQQQRKNTQNYRTVVYKSLDEMFKKK